MALVETYVDPDNSAGTDYTSLNAWEAGEQTDLVTDGDSHKVWCESSSGSADTTAVTIDGWSTGASNTVTIQAAEGHEASTEWDATKYRIVTNIYNKSTIKNTTAYVTINGLQCEQQGDGNYVEDCIVVDLGVNNDYVLIKNCYVRYGGSGTHSNAIDQAGITVLGNVDIENCIVDKFDITDKTMAGIETRYGTHLIVNCVVHGCYYGIRERSGTTSAINCAVFDCTYDFSSVAVSYCASDDGDGTNAVTPADWSTVFEDAANGDFTLKSTDTDLINAGIGTTDSNVPTTDINGVSRDSATCDIGAAEYVAAVTNLLTNYYYTHLMQGGL